MDEVNQDDEVYCHVFVMDGELFVQDERYEAYPTLDEWWADNDMPTEVHQEIH